jgi:ketosteroid isomerase-like protein
MRPEDPLTLEDLLDRAAINDVLDDYAHAVDERDWERLRSLFTPDATLDYTAAGGPRGTRDEVVDWIAAALPAVALTQHLLTNRRIRTDGDTATARCELLNPLLLDGDAGAQLLLLGGRYDDRLQRHGDSWLFTERVHTTTWTAGPTPARLSTPEA